MKINVNGSSHELGDVDPGTPLLWILRDELNMTGTKYGCGKGLCGACTLHVDGQPKRACTLRVDQVGSGKVTTIEGLSKAGDHAVQEAWQAGCVPQCGFCQPGQIMTAAALLTENKQPDDEDIDNAMSGNICRCGTYTRIRQAIKDAAYAMRNPLKAGAKGGSHD